MHARVAPTPPGTQQLLARRFRDLISLALFYHEYDAIGSLVQSSGCRSVGTAEDSSVQLFYFPAHEFDMDMASTHIEEALAHGRTIRSLVGKGVELDLLNVLAALLDYCR